MSKQIIRRYDTLHNRVTQTDIEEIGKVLLVQHYKTKVESGSLVY